MNTARPQPGERRRWPALLLLFLVGGVLCLGGTLAAQSVTGAPKTQFIPVTLHSVLEADYRQNPNPPRLPPLRPDIIWEAMFDQNPAAENLAARQAALLNSLQIPVSFVTPVVCQGNYSIYADRDSWVDSGQPAAAHGRDESLQLGRDNGQTRRILLHFRLEDALPPGVFIAAARLELTPTEAPPAGAPKLDVFNLSGPFNETTVTWADQPETYLVDQPQPLPMVNRHAWDVTGLVQAWLLGHYPHDGLAVEAPLALSYYSREADRQIANGTNRLGPRLVIECGGSPTPAPQAVAEAKPSVSITPGPDTPQIEAANTPPSPLTGTPALPTLLPTPLLSPTPLLFTPTPLLPSPTLPLPSPTLPLPSPTLPLPSPTLPLPSPTLPPPSPTLPLATPTAPLPGSPTPLPTVAPMPTIAPTLTPVPTVPTSPPPTSKPPTSTSTPIPPTPIPPTSTPIPPPPNLSINDVAVEETNGLTQITFTVTLSAATTSVVTVNYTTADGAATIADNDYTYTSGALTFPPGTTVQTLTVQVNGDTKFEPDETFYVNLSNPVNAGLANDQGEGVISNDDVLVGISYTCIQTDTFMQDAWIDQNAPTTNYGGDTLLKVQPPSPENRILIQFKLNLSPIPAGSTVLTATLNLYNTDKTSPTISVEQVTSAWVEGEVTWQNRDAGHTWSASGGDFISTGITFTPPGKGDTFADVTTLARDWITTGTPNYGLLLRATGDNAAFNSREKSSTQKRPELCVFYQP